MVINYAVTTVGVDLTAKSQAIEGLKKWAQSENYEIIGGIVVEEQPHLFGENPMVTIVASAIARKI